MSCPYSDLELERWDSVCNPMGDDCYICQVWDCEHNTNIDNPEFIQLDEYSGLFEV